MCPHRSRMSPRYLTTEVSCNVCPEGNGSFRPLKSPVWVNGTVTTFCGLIAQSYHIAVVPFSTPPVEALRVCSGIFCRWLQFICLPLCITAILIEFSCEFLHSRGNRASPYGEPVATDPSRFGPANVAVIFLLPSIEQIYQQTVSPSPCHLTAFVMLSNEVLSKASSVYVITWCSAVSVVGRQIGIHLGDRAPKFCLWYACLPISPSFRAWRMID
jgi:hypothetical protein